VTRREETLGGLLVGLASLLFGSVVIFGRFVLREGVTVPSMLAMRFGIAAVLLAIALVLSRRPLLAARGERRALALLALFGYSVESALFFAGVQHGTAAAVTLLFYTYPALVTLGVWALGRGAPAGMTILALGCAVGGTAIVVGFAGGLAVEPIGAALALGSALTYAAYLIGADLVLERTSPMTSAMWVSGGASLALLVFALASGQWAPPSTWDGWWPLLCMGAATAAAFVCLLAGLQRLGAVRTSIVAATEPLSTALLAFAFLDESVALATVAGGVLILAGAVIASVARGPMAQEQQIP
jgi:drug/metabolite transporter (DMT)-like permease